jgi:hypothetical protein
VILICAVCTILICCSLTIASHTQSTKAEELWNDANAGDEASLNTDLIGINATDFLFQKVRLFIYKKCERKYPNIMLQLQVGPMGWDCTALAVAAFHGHDDIVRKLIQAGAKVDMQDQVRSAVWSSSPILTLS